MAIRPAPAPSFTITLMQPTLVARPFHAECFVYEDERSPYVEGRTLAWRKVKQPKYREVERGFYKSP